MSESEGVMLIWHRKPKTVFSEVLFWQYGVLRETMYLLPIQHKTFTGVRDFNVSWLNVSHLFDQNEN